MVLHDITDCPGLFIEFSPAGHAEVLSHGDLHALDVVPAPDGFEKRVGKAEVENVLDRLFAKVMVDAEDSRLGKNGVQDLIQGLGRGKVTSERLLDDYTSIFSNACFSQSLHYGSKHTRRDGQVVQGLLRGTECLTQFCIGCLIVIVTGDVLKQ